jgi:hypothetical protein
VIASLRTRIEARTATVAMPAATGTGL